ncbi:hypothetical protein M0Q97_05665 [Candidatus Dojkabacteria bacterium]|nr:hypothetical protein [Candidatus Dojkabacteria bacterium]
MNNKDIIFFNKEGFPHNFQYNEDTESWEGKILFDENSDQTFRTQSLHIFENVKPIEFNINADLININYNNNSGLTFKGETNFQNELITNIQKVNDSDKFYSKWIYGNDFHKKFPIGTIISLSGVTGSTDFSDDKYFTVLAVKKHAILIITDTANDIFNFTYIPSGYTNSLNVISINDYNRNLSGETLFNNLYENKKLTILNSNYNDSVISVKQSGITSSYLNELKLNGLQNNIFNLKIELFTERPKIYQGDITLNNNILTFNKNITNLAPEIIYTSTGTDLSKKEIQFEDINGNKLFSGYTFLIDSLIDEKYIATKKLLFKQYYQQSNNYTNTLNKTSQWNTIQFTGYTNLNVGDVISLSGASTGYTYLMNNRELSISDVVYNSVTNTTILFIPEFIFDENGLTYNIYQKLKPHQIRSAYATPSGDITEFNNSTYSNSYCFLTTNYLNFSQIYSSGNTYDVNENTIINFITKYKTTLTEYGIDIYLTLRNNEHYLSIESLYGTKYPYFCASGYTNGIQISNDYSLTNNGLTNKFDIITNEALTDEKTNKSDDGLYKNQIESEILFNLYNDTEKFGFRLTLNGIEYFINFSGDTQTTINAFIDKYGIILYNNGFIINSGYNFSYSGYTLIINTDIDIWDLEVMVNILSSYDILQNNRNRSILISGNEIKTTTNLFDIGLATGMILKISGSTFYENNKEYNIIGLTENEICLSYQGIFISENNVDIYCKTRDFIRKPRGKYNRDIYFNVSWIVSYDNVIDKSIFLYDITGNQLTPYNGNDAYKYIGQKPLIDSSENVVFLNELSNNDLSKISNPKYQQTIFTGLTFKLEQLDSSLEYNWIPEPLEIFMGYKASEEGVNNRILKIEKVEKHENNSEYFSYSGYTNSGSSYSISNFIFSDTTLDFKAPIDFSFISYGFEKNQLIKFYFTDQSKTNQRIFENVYTYKIKDITKNKIIIDSDYVNYNEYNLYDSGITYNSSGFTYFTTTGTTFKFKIEVQPKEILSCSVYGQTEIEDIRFKVNLNNLGIQSENDVYEILYESDIDDYAIDYTLFNEKRKEMLLICRDIYDYIGSYKSLINAINYFGYNDLQLYEYYKNIDKSSSLYGKLHKILIPDIFDNSVEGWNEMDFISGKYQQQNIWKKTNLFNLSYKITDEDGNNVLIYSLDDVQYKLTKLKKWLRKNIIPISANLLDITGVSDTNQTLYQEYDESNQTKMSVVERNSTVVNFNYTATLNFGSDYLITVNFYTLSGTTGTTIDNNDTPISFSAKIKTFYLSGSTIYNPTDILIPVQYFKINKNDLKPFSFNIDKYVDPYIYIETTTYDNDGNGLGYVNNKLFYYDEPRNHWLVNHNFDLTYMKYYQTTDYVSNIKNNIISDSTALNTSVETIVKVNTLNNTYISQISINK